MLMVMMMSNKGGGRGPIMVTNGPPGGGGGGGAPVIVNNAGSGGGGSTESGSSSNIQMMPLILYFLLKSPTSTPTLSSDWKYFHHTNKHYRLMTSTRNWDDARNDCKHYGGDLASVTSAYEKEFIESLVISTRAWLRGSSSDGVTMYWSDGSTFGSYDSWNAG